MARVEVGSTEDLKELITSQPLSVTKASGLAGVIAAVLLPLSTALGWFDGKPASVVIAAMGLVAVAFVVVGYVVVSDQRIRSEQTIASKRLQAECAKDDPRPPDGNGHATRVTARRVIIVGGDGNDEVIEIGQSS
jgi:hypothetical protein